MRTHKSWRTHLAIVAALLLLSAGTALAQYQSGDVHGIVTDDSGGPLPGVRVTLTGNGAPKDQFTNTEGQFRFLGLSPGAYELRAELDGFGVLEYPNVRVGVGRNTSIEFALSPAVEEVITVTAESPLLDERKITAGTSISAVELEKIPTSRDPWGILNQTPGVVTDRINVGGNESGQQSVFVGNGSGSNENGFAVDGVIITDMAAIGSSPTYYDFDAFEEIQVTTGGTDVSVATGGVTMNLVTKRGTNQWRGSARYLVTDGDTQSSPSIGAGEAGRNFNGPGGSEQTQDLDTFEPNEIDEIQDYGVEAGGFLVKDRVWLWGAYGENQIDNILAGGSLDATTLENWNAKLNGQLGASNSAVFQFSRGDKIKNGRVGFPSTQRSPETAWDQSGPTEVFKIEDTHVFNSNFYLTGLYSFVDGGFGLVTKDGGAADKDAFVDSDGVFHGAWLDFVSERDVNQYRLDGSYFFNAGNTSHELKFGGSFREADTNSLTVHPKGRLVYSCAYFGCDGQAGGTEVVKLARNRALDYSTEYTALWLQDTFTTERWTINAGLRYDEQNGNNGQTQVSAVTIGDRTFFSDIDFSGDNGGDFNWETISPRVGLTYALGEQRDTLLRANFSRFAEQLRQGHISVINPASYTYGYGYFDDANGNLLLDDDEVQSVDVFYYYGFDPDNPEGGSPNQIDPGFDPSIIDEIRLGVEHSLMPELVVGLDLTYRRISDLSNYLPLIVDANGNQRLATAADYDLQGTVAGQLSNGQGYSEPFYSLNPGVSATGGRRLFTGDRAQDYTGTTLFATKRLSNRWMMRGNFTYYDWEYDIGDQFKALDDPTDVLEVSGALDLDDTDGGVVAEQSEGSGGKRSIYQNARWSFNLNGMYQLPKNWNIAGNLSGREGFPNVRFHQVTGNDGITRQVQINLKDSDRHSEIFTLDLRLEKEFTINDFSASLALDGFNLFNANTTLQRQGSATSGTFDYIQETLSPRVFRLGLRVNWN